MSTSCSRCHRTLKNPIYVAIGMGKVCLAKSQAESEKQKSLYDPELLPGNPLKVGVIIKRLPNGKLATNIERRVVQHSNTGFEIGYAGSGPADFALNILNIFLPITNKDDESICYEGTKCSKRAYSLHQQFKEQFLASQEQDKKCRNKNGYVIPVNVIKRWIEKK
ncbi:MAG: hypothetical protein PHS33_09330 [Candidatus Omnitrophica bacterium]|nr:hypothetical protein [Candidatus Omnitrophota bacterium]